MLPLSMKIRIVCRSLRNITHFSRNSLAFKFYLHYFFETKQNKFNQSLVIIRIALLLLYIHNTHIYDVNALPDEPSKI